jgi:hypothetical protein
MCEDNQKIFNDANSCLKLATGSVSGSGSVVGSVKGDHSFAGGLNSSVEHYSDKNFRKSKVNFTSSQPYGGYNDTSSLMGSIADRTDKIINYSGFVNTSTEELIEEVEGEESQT